MAKGKVSISPLIRLALEDLIDRANRKVIAISEEDRQLAIHMLEKLAEFTAENAIDPRNERTDKLAIDNQWLDQKWQWVQDECFQRIHAIASGAEFRETDFAMVREVLSIVCVDLMVNMRTQLVDRFIR